MQLLLLKFRVWFNISALVDIGQFRQKGRLSVLTLWAKAVHYLGTLWTKAVKYLGTL
jgi:hypothetical protein